MALSRAEKGNFPNGVTAIATRLPKQLSQIITKPSRAGEVRFFKRPFTTRTPLRRALKRSSTRRLAGGARVEVLGPVQHDFESFTRTRNALIYKNFLGTRHVGADLKLSQVNNLLCCIFVHLGMRRDHHGHDWQDPAFAYPVSISTGGSTRAAVLLPNDLREPMGIRDCLGRSRRPKAKQIASP